MVVVALIVAPVPEALGALAVLAVLVVPVAPVAPVARLWDQDPSW